MSARAGLYRGLAWPASLVTLAGFLRTQLAAFPGRGNVTLRCVLGAAIVITTSMALQVPELPLSLMVVFYVTQSNIVLTRVIAINLMIGVTCSIAMTICVYALTFDDPLLRIVIASAIFFCGVYLMRAVTKFALVFYLVSLIVIYAQSFADLTDNAEALVRACLWVWAAVSYAVAVSLVINTVLLPAEPERQLRDAMRGQLAMVAARLASLSDSDAPTVRVGALDVERSVLALQKLLRFASMRRHYDASDAAAALACVTAVSRLVEAAADLPDEAVTHDLSSLDAIRMLQGELAATARAIDDDLQWPRLRLPAVALPHTPVTGLAAMQRALDALGDASAIDTPRVATPSVLSRDVFTNPRYARFALRTLLSVLLCYVFYNAVNWPGIHTIMLTCLVVALPSIGASSRHGLLRISGALTGSALALLMVSFVIPQLESITGLLLMSLPVIALGAWVSAGSERIGYAGIQIMFTFALALLSSFAPPSDLTEIRDRMVGILLGVGVATGMQMALWPEGEADTLRAQLAAVLRDIAGLARASAARLVADGAPDAESTTNVGRAPMPPSTAATWAHLAECEAMLARVALEPDWREGETARVTLLSQTILAQARTVLAGLGAFGDEALETGPRSELRRQAADFESHIADTLDRYAMQLAAEQPIARSVATLDEAKLRATWTRFEERAARALSVRAQRLDAALAGLPRWSLDAVSVNGPATAE
ncbi:FUSC family protein [Pararobbsia silviterrae]|uniref:FUSC family protein n=1 Tax=Pararobbsia silviterrae TaxID=1792498 RepID=A0A494XAL8_9BURK|nr:FUSC family protein [Pararobbsia silviterrae]RKP47132.1 FUSC family protein [Pararobbsia silviterrae]